MSETAQQRPSGEGPDESHLQGQIDLIARHEEDFLHRRTLAERVGDALGAGIGSLWFVCFHACWIAAWIAWNLVQGTHHFDPSPFPLLDTVVAIEAIFLASVIVMRQTRQSRRAEERDHLILQMMILTEREMTAVLGIERQLASRLGLTEVAADQNLKQMSEETPIDEIRERLQEHMPEH